MADMKPLLVLMPGLDGTGDLFDEFAAELEGFCEILVLRYPKDQALDYGALQPLVLRQLPLNRPLVLLGESFSGPLALRLAVLPELDCRGVILAASFARYPLWWLAPVRHWVRHLKPLFGVLQTRLFSQFTELMLKPGISDKALKVSREFDREVILSRISTLLAEDATPQLLALKVPVLYLRALLDLIVPYEAWRYVNKHRPDMITIDFAAHHLVLQAKPKEAAVAVRGFTAGLK